MVISPELRSYYGFFDTLSDLERLVNARDSLIHAYSDINGIGKAILQKIQELVSTSSIVCYYDCCAILDRLIAIRTKICKQSQQLEDDIGRKHHSVEAHLHWGGVLDQLMELKLDNLIALSSERYKVGLLERLASMGKVVPDSKLTGIISEKIGILASKDWVSTTSDDVSSESSELVMTPEGSEPETPMQESKHGNQADDPKKYHGNAEELWHDLRRAESNISKLSLEVTDTKDMNALLDVEKAQLHDALKRKSFEKQRMAKDLAECRHSFTLVVKERDTLQSLLNESIDPSRMASPPSHAPTYSCVPKPTDRDRYSIKLGTHLEHGTQALTDAASAAKGPFTSQYVPANCQGWSPGANVDKDCDCPTFCVCDRPRRSQSDCGCSETCECHESEMDTSQERDVHFKRPRALHTHTANTVTTATKNLDRDIVWAYPLATKPADEDTHSNIDGGETRFSDPGRVGPSEYYTANRADKKIMRQERRSTGGIIPRKSKLKIDEHEE